MGKNVLMFRSKVCFILKNMESRKMATTQLYVLLKLRLNSDVVQHIRHMVLRDTHLLINGCMIRMVNMAVSCNSYSVLWEFTELFETLHDHLCVLNLKFTARFNRFISHMVHMFKIKLPECQTKFQYWLLLQAWRRSLLA